MGLQKVKVIREDLLTTLQAAEAGLSNNEKLEQSTCFCCRKGKIITFNQEVCVRVPSPFPKEFTGAVQSRSFLGWLKKVPERNLTVKFHDHELELQGKGKGTKVRFAQKITLPLDDVEVPDKDGWSDLPANFNEAISIVQECTGNEKKKTALACVHVTPRWVEASEGFQATRYKIKLPIDGPFLVKPKGLKHVVAMGCGEINVGREWVHFRNPLNVVVSCRRYVEDFQDLTSALQMDGGVSAELPEGLEGAVERGEVFSKENQDNFLVVAIEDGLLTVTAVGATGKCWEDHSVRYKGDPFAFLIAPNMLAEVVKRSNKVKITREKLKVKGPNWSYVTALTDPEEAIAKAEEKAGTHDEDDGEGD